MSVIDLYADGMGSIAIKSTKQNTYDTIRGEEKRTEYIKRAREQRVNVYWLDNVVDFSSLSV